jgi:hypothetical protein
MVIKRIIFDIVFFLSVFMLPWWVTTILAFAGIFIFKRFYEFVVIFVIMYSLYLIPSPRFSPFYFSLILSVVYLFIQFLKHYIILYKNELSY